MEIQELITFVTIAKHNSFSRASEHLGYSQAAVTVHIRNLEQELQVRLFDRLGKKISLTGQGRIFYEHACQVLTDYRLACESVKQNEPLTGTLRLGTIDSLCASVFPDILEKYHQRHPGVFVTVTTDTPAVLMNKLNNNDIDVVYLLDEQLNDARWIKVLDAMESAVFAVSSRHPLAQHPVCTLEELLAFPFILTEKDASYRRVLDYELRLRHLEILPQFESNNTDLILNMVRSNMGATFLPEYSIIGDLEKGIITKLDVPSFQIHVWRQVIHHKDKWVSREMQAFFELLQELEAPASTPL